MLETHADVGIAYDGDSDRVGAVDEKGQVLWGDQLMILFARAILAEVPGAAIVGEVKCSFTLYDDIKAARRPRHHVEGRPLAHQGQDEGGARRAGRRDERPHLLRPPLARLRRRHLLVGAAAWSCSPAPTSPCRRCWPTCPRPSAPRSCASTAAEEIKFEVVRRAQAFFSKGYQAITVDGVRVVFPDGWGLVRASNTQPILVLRFEATTEPRLAEIRKLVEDEVSTLIAGARRPVTARLALGVDLGGTNARAALVDVATGTVVAAHKLPHAERTPAAVVATIAAAVNEAARLAGVDPRTLGTAGVGVAGQCLGSTGTVLNAPNLGWRDVPLGEPLAGGARARGAGRQRPLGGRLGRAAASARRAASTTRRWSSSAPASAPASSSVGGSTRAAAAWPASSGTSRWRRAGPRRGAAAAASGAAWRPTPAG